MHASSFYRYDPRHYQHARLANEQPCIMRAAAIVLQLVKSFLTAAKQLQNFDVSHLVAFSLDWNILIILWVHNVDGADSFVLSLLCDLHESVCQKEWKMCAKRIAVRTNHLVNGNWFLL